MRNYLKNGALLVGMLLGVLGLANNAAAFTMSATIQNALTVNQTTPIAFGTLFATSTSTGASQSPVVLSPAGNITTANAVAGVPKIFAVGGTPTAGVYVVPSVPIGSSIAVQFKTAANNNKAATSATCQYSDAATARAANRITMTSTVAPSPDFVGFFCVDNFTANISGTDVTATLLDTAVGYLVPGGSGGTVTFNLGTSLIGQRSTSAAVAFEAGAYSATFGMEVIFP